MAGAVNGGALIEVDDLVKIYPNAVDAPPALGGVTLRVTQGEFVAAMGPSGSGKSTFMNIVGCLDAPTRGRYRLAGREVETLDHNQLAELRNRTLGFVFQGFNLLPRLTALENVMLPMVYAGVARAERRERARQMLAATGLGALGDRRPSQLSGGQQQRVAIARALVNRPLLLLADEPTGNLDTQTARDVMDVFTRLNREQGITVLLVTHEPDIAQYARRLIKFRDGHVVYDGGPEGAQ
ncbi:MAG: ABC transporter ATP-binding protein [Burkholderiales bacterium]|nr:ABC transporter ATP-binding protein [Burkholderiales bacterium]